MRGVAVSSNDSPDMVFVAALSSGPGGRGSHPESESHDEYLVVKRRYMSRINDVGCSECACPAALPTQIHLRTIMSVCGYIQLWKDTGISSDEWKSSATDCQVSACEGGATLVWLHACQCSQLVYVSFPQEDHHCIE